MCPTGRRGDGLLGTPLGVGAGPDQRRFGVVWFGGLHLGGANVSFTNFSKLVNTSGLRRLPKCRFAQSRDFDFAREQSKGDRFQALRLPFRKSIWSE